LQAKGPEFRLGSFVVMVMAMMVPGRGKRRRGNHHNDHGCEQKFSHACIVALVLLGKPATLHDELKNAHQERNGEKQDIRIELKQRVWLSLVAH